MCAVGLHKSMQEDIKMVVHRAFDKRACVAKTIDSVITKMLSHRNKRDTFFTMIQLLEMFTKPRKLQARVSKGLFQ